jgi:hypothetical protein
MITLKHAEGFAAAALSVGTLMQYGITTHAQSATNTCRPPQMIPLTTTEVVGKGTVKFEVPSKGAAGPPQ